jgi:hypothetical protein
VLEKIAPAHEIENQVVVRVLNPPEGCEDIR